MIYGAGAVGSVPDGNDRNGTEAVAGDGGVAGDVGGAAGGNAGSFRYVPLPAGVIGCGVTAEKMVAAVAL